MRFENRAPWSPGIRPEHRRGWELKQARPILGWHEPDLWPGLTDDQAASLAELPGPPPDERSPEQRLDDAIDSLGSL